MAASGPWDEIAKSYDVHDESYSYTERLKSMGFKEFHTLALEDARKQGQELARAFSGEVDFQGEIKELLIPSSSVPEGVPITIYKSQKCEDNPNIFIYFHGGGLVLFDRKCYESCLKAIAQKAAAIVINVGYRLLPNPQHEYAPFDDAIAVVKWTIENKVVVGGGAESKLGVGGDGAGGQIAAAAVSEVEGLDFQVLIHPLVDTSSNHPSYKDFTNAPGFGPKDFEWFQSLIAKPGGNTLNDPRFNPMMRSSTELSPPTLILLTRLDPLRDGGMAYAEKLRSSGVRVRIVVMEGVPNTFFGFCGHFKEKCQEAYGHVVTFLQDFQDMEN